ncbi:polyphosphate kinase 1 [Winogradskyella endarachnes]|uniref:Polyphosphate kinase n=1 Tax=Winogradskyella endarachnes TaxID=2681965 RepID=A0A6L6U6F7_9FLAO|nr:polyphosphate kinase 1 [Winogradskyella endarachnes]MUU77801.1 polyphosphate kinase 1 [Winogradskyella endarachnes]
MKLYNSKVFHRDLSWLRFNHRVLQEASDKRNPLYERIKFLSIFSSNLDEFYKVRVSDIRQIKNLKKPFRKKLITKPNKVLKEINKQVDIQQQEFGKIFKEQIIPDLKAENIHLINHNQFSTSQQQIALDYFENQLISQLNLESSFYSLDASVFVENENSYLVAFLERKFQLIKIPKSESRFFSFPEENGNHFITFIDDILRHALSNAFNEDVTYYAIKISRDAELYIEDEFSGDLMKKIKASLPNRETGQPTRILIDSEMPKKERESLKTLLDVSIADFILGGNYHNFKDFYSFPNPTDKDFSYPIFKQIEHSKLSKANYIFDVIDEKDQLLHYPYHSFTPVIQLLETAANDPTVSTIKMTMYRLADESRLNTALAKAAKNGKNVIIFIEVKARFDEENNIKWGQIFKENGATVIYSYAEIKVHSKIIYIEREIEDKTKRYALISTGNFNEKTSKIYSDFSLITANKKITKDINKVFLVLQGITIIPKTKLVVVSPFKTRQTFENLIQNEIDIAKNGNNAYIILKMNSLEDKKLISKLYQASNAGVQIKLIVRGICCLIPGIKNQSENITITSIVDRYLEHSRVYIFGNNKKEVMYIGSADWMTRNLNHRIEVLTPILDADIHKTIRDIITLQLNDNTKARRIDKQQNNIYVSSTNKDIRAQYATYNYIKELKN